MVAKAFLVGFSVLHINVDDVLVHNVVHVLP